MSAILIPEVVIFNTLNAILKALKSDLSNGAVDKETYLYSLLGEDSLNQKLQINRYNMFEQAKHIFSKTEGVSVNYGYNLEVASKDVALHIILPSENGRPLTIGGDEGYDTDENGTTKFTQVFDSVYQIMITSTNQAEAMLVYHVLKSMLLLLFPHMELSGLRDVKISGSDVLINQEYVPNHIFHKVINLSFFYELSVSTKIIPSIIESLTFIGTYSETE